MPREELQTASDELRQAAADLEGDLRERVYDQSSQLAKLATRDLGPDHGRLDRHMNALSEIAEGLDGEPRDLVESARDHVREYRTGVEGV
ncbi:MAG: hypothetical protein ABEJ28_07615 [Salinigranum sp.]